MWKRHQEQLATDTMQDEEKFALPLLNTRGHHLNLIDHCGTCYKVTLSTRVKQSQTTNP